MESQNLTKENNYYQSVLDRVYGEGNIIVLERYINPNAVLIHSCSCCGKFYAKPRFLVNKDSQKHECFTSYGDSNNKRKSFKKNFKHNNSNDLSSQETKNKIEKMLQEGKGVKVIARKLNVLPGAIIHYLKTKNMTK